VIDKQGLFSRVYGCIVGGTIGDAFGGVVEGARAEDMLKTIGTDWLEDFLPYPTGWVDERNPAPWRCVGNFHWLGTWEIGAPRGTGTDDTRGNHIFLEAVIRNKGVVNSELLALEWMDHYSRREEHYPAHPDFAEMHLRRAFQQSFEYLRLRYIPGGEAAWASRAHGRQGYPGGQGLISLAFAGLLCANDPEQAYRRAFELGFLDYGYGRDATAMMAAMISAAIGGEVTAREMIEIGLTTNPFGWQQRVMEQWVRRMVELADAPTSDRDLVYALAPEAAEVGGFDARDILGAPAAAVYYANGDMLRSLVIAGNHRSLDVEGNFIHLRDSDCLASVAGALVGALNGIEAFPEDWVADVLEANKRINNIDIEANARRFYEAVYGA